MVVCLIKTERDAYSQLSIYFLQNIYVQKHILLLALLTIKNPLETLKDVPAKLRRIPCLTAIILSRYNKRSIFICTNSRLF